MSSISAPITFAGASTYSNSFQQVLTRAVQIASLPLQQMQNTVSDLSNQQAVLYGLENTFSNLQRAVQTVATAAGSSLSASVTNPSAVSVATTSDAQAGTYTIQVDNLGSSTTTLSKAGLTTVTDPTAADISSSSTFTLTLNGTAHTISPSGSSLKSLASAINDAGVGVQATIVNVGPTASPDYRLAISSNQLGADTIALSDSAGTPLLDTLQTGTNAAYKVNGIGTDIENNSRQVTLAPGVTVNLLQQTTSGIPVTITVAKNYSSLQSALSSLASNYNAAVDALGQQRGENAGPLSGQAIVFSLKNSLSVISQFASATGLVRSISDLGLNLDETGHLSFDQTAFQGQAADAVQQFLGTTTSSGFLKTANDALTAVSDNTSGLIASNINTLQDQVTNQNDHITAEQTRITDLQTSLQLQLAKADAAIATLEQQKNYFTNLFAALYLNNKDQNGSTG